jgi:thioredoxin reductase
MTDTYDAVVVGGGAAGLSGALMLARMRRRVRVVDAGQPRNAPAHGVHGLLGHDGIPPGELLERGRAEVRGYGGEVVPGVVTAVTREDGLFRVALADGGGLLARRLLVATGLVDELPDVAGLGERWGRDVVHCPYCHGWEVRDRAIGVLGTNAMSVHAALLFRGLTDDVVFLAHTVPPDPGQAEQLAAVGIPVIEGPFASVVVEDDGITGVRAADGRLVPRDVLAVGTTLVARADFLAGIGLVPEPHPSGMGTRIPADAMGRTAVPGVFVAGNVTDVSAQVGAASAAGALAGALINADLVTEDTAGAVEARRRRAGAATC